MRKNLFLLLVLAGQGLQGQEAERGFAMPVTITGGALFTHRLQSEDPEKSNAAAGFHAVLYPGVKLGGGWFASAAFQLNSANSFYYDTYYKPKFQARLIQGLVGYTRSSGRRSVTFKAGHLVSAFGSFPLRYDDQVNALLDQPLSYASRLQLRADQLPCQASELPHQMAYGHEVHFYCGGAGEESYGIAPVTLYGLPAAQMDVSLARLDARFQVTNSSPANPHGLLSRSQHAQWTAGAGYTIRQGLRIGASGFRGPYLDQDVYHLLPAGRGPGDYPARGIGIDVQWARGRWSVEGEWQRFAFDYPRFTTSPAVTFAQVEVKATIHPRFYAAVRAGGQRHNRPADLNKRLTGPFSPNRQSWEFALGFRPNRRQLLKVGYEWMRIRGVSGMRDNVLGIQLVTSLDSLSRAIK